jgi:Aspartate/tyrosine/aromatic aminotransferase
MTGTPSRRGSTPPFHVMEVARAATERQRSHADAILLCVGQPATPAPLVVREAAARAVTAEVLGYTVSAGRDDLRELIASSYRRQGAQVTAEQVVITTGSSAAFSLVVLAAFEAGATVAMARPGYPAYRNTLGSLGCRVVDLPVGEQTRYQPTVELLDGLDPKPSGVVIASPANPTGTIIDADALAAVAAWCQANDCLLISDEIYHGISYGRACVTAAGLGDSAVVLGSLSKYHSMTGWRLGWAVLPQWLARPVELLQGNLAICAPAISQAAALAAFGDEARRELDAHVGRYARNRELLLRRLPELGITGFAPPDGAFYVWCDVTHLTDDSQAWCARLLADTGIALAPGVDFDPIDGHTKVRLSFCGETAELATALDRLEEYLQR